MGSQAMSDERFSSSTPTVLDSADGTPPERQTRLPLTPPATDESPSTLNPKSPVSMVLHLIRQRQHYISADQSRQVKVKPSEYKSLLARLQQLPELQSFVNDKLRLEYNPLEEVLYIRRMPTTIHESFSERVSEETKAQLQHIKDGNDEAARFAERISSVRSGSIQLREIDSNDDVGVDRPYIQRQPDNQFQHDEAEYPGVVYEVACSQNTRDLRRAAWTYIQYSNANIKAVVGFELGYGTKKEARISMWKPRYLKDGEEGLDTLDVEAVIDRDVFRSSDGFAINTTKALHLPSTASLILRLQPSTLKSFQALQFHTHSLRSFWTKRRGSNAQNNPCWERKALARNQDGQPRRGSVLRPQLEKSLLTKRWNFATQKTRCKGAQWSRTVIFEVRLGVLWMNR